MNCIWIGLFFVITVVVKCEIPEYISICHHDVPDLAACIKNSIEKLRPYLKNGLKEINVPPLNVVELEPISIGSISEGSQIATNITNLKFWGISEFQLLNLTTKATKNGRVFYFEAKVPYIHIEGNYAINSKIVFVNLQGEGPFNANLTEYYIRCVMNGAKVNKNGANYMVFEDFQCTGHSNKPTILLENLFNGNQVLGKATNDVINDNSDTLLNEIRPTVVKAIREEFRNIANKITSSFTYEELFP